MPLGAAAVTEIGAVYAAAQFQAFEDTGCLDTADPCVVLVVTRGEERAATTECADLQVSTTDALTIGEVLGQQLGAR